MDDKSALHTAARRYCRRRFSEWSDKCTEIQAQENWQVGDQFQRGWDYSDEAYKTFPRYRVDQAIEVEVEKLNPLSDGSLEELRMELLAACDSAETTLCEELKHPLARAAVVEEAGDYRAYVRSLRSSHLRIIEALPYRRVVTQEESEGLWNQLKMNFGIESGSWFPLKEGACPADVIAFHTDFFEHRDGGQVLHDALQTHGVSRVFQLQEFRAPEYEIEISAFEPFYGSGGEQYSTSEAVDWVVYASHESSITIAGGWLTAIFKERWPDWMRHTYGGPFSTSDLRGTWEAK